MLLKEGSGEQTFQGSPHLGAFLLTQSMRGPLASLMPCFREKRVAMGFQEREGLWHCLGLGHGGGAWSDGLWVQVREVMAKAKVWRVWGLCCCPQGHNLTVLSLPTLSTSLQVGSGQK